MDVDKGPGSAKELIKSINEKFAGSAGWEGTESLKKPEDKKQLGDFFGMSNSYAECYPATMDDMAVDSDEEVDYSKMDQVWCWKDGWGVLAVTLWHIPPSSLPTDLCLIFWDLTFHQLLRAAALWSHGKLNF